MICGIRKKNQSKSKTVRSHAVLSAAGSVVAVITQEVLNLSLKSAKSEFVRGIFLAVNINHSLQRPFNPGFYINVASATSPFFCFQITWRSLKWLTEKNYYQLKSAKYCNSKELNHRRKSRSVYTIFFHLQRPLQTPDRGLRRCGKSMDQADIAKQQKLENVLLIEISAIPSSKIWNVAVLDELKTIKLFGNKKYMPLCCKTSKYIRKYLFIITKRLKFNATSTITEQANLSSSRQHCRATKTIIGKGVQHAK